MKPRIKSTLLAFAVASVSSLTLAAEKVSPEQQEAYQRKLFAQLDANKDSKVSEKEFAVAVLWEDFVRYDTNKDGKVSKAEYDAQTKTKDIWTQLDPAGKGFVTFEDCCKSDAIVNDLRAEWRRLTSKLGKDKANVSHFTMDDLPDLTP